MAHGNPTSKRKTGKQISFRPFEDQFEKLEKIISYELSKIDLNLELSPQDILRNAIDEIYEALPEEAKIGTAIKQAS